MPSFEHDTPCLTSVLLRTALLRLLTFATITALLLLAGCSDEEEINEPPAASAGSFPDTPDQLMVNFQSALSERDLAALQDVIHPDFKFLINQQDIEEFLLPTDHLNSFEVLVAADNMFSGEVILHPGGSITAAVSAITIDVFTPVDPAWTASEPDSPFPGAQRRLYDVHLEIERPGNATLVVQGRQEFFVTSRDSVLGDGTARPFHQIWGQCDLITLNQSTEDETWGMALIPYYTNHPPMALFSYTPLTEGILNAFRFDASESFDPDSGLHTAPYRWRFASDQDFSVWSRDPIFDYTFPTPGQKNVHLQVRDRWGLIDTALQDLAVGAVFPGTEDQLLANFLWSFRALDLEGYDGTLHHNFRFKFQGFDVERFDLPSHFLDRHEELEVAELTFAPESNIVAIRLEQFYNLMPWTDSPSHPDFPGSRRSVFFLEMSVERADTNDLRIEGLQEFFTVSRDSVLPGGEVRPFFEMVGQIDQSNAHKMTELVSWGAFKVMHTPSHP